MQFFDDRESIMYITSLNLQPGNIPKYRNTIPSRKACETAPHIFLDPAFGGLQYNTDSFHNSMKAQGYKFTYDADFLLNGTITCSEPNRQVSPGLLYYCLIGKSDFYTRSPDDPIFQPDNCKRFLVLDFRPSPDDLPWKPYYIDFSPKYLHFKFMALNTDSKVVTADWFCPRIGFHFELSITHKAANQFETYNCRWIPAHSHGHQAPFSILYELYFNAKPFNHCGIAQRTIRYESYPGLRPITTVNQLRVYGDQTIIVDQDPPTN